MAVKLKSLKKGLRLACGGHAAQDAFCVMEAVAYVAGEPWSDRPQCVSPVIAAFLRRWNDDLNDDDRQMLKPYIRKVVGTNTGKADDEKRAWLVTDWMVREYMPAWLDAANLKQQADAVRALPPILSVKSWEAGKPTVDNAKTKSTAAWAAAWAAAWDAARAAAGDAAGAAAWAAAGDAAGDAARAAAGAAAGAAAWDAARAAAWAAAGDAAKKKLRPHVESIQKSALKLIDRMIAVGK